MYTNDQNTFCTHVAEKELKAARATPRINFFGGGIRHWPRLYRLSDHSFKGCDLQPIHPHSALPYSYKQKSK